MAYTNPSKAIALAHEMADKLKIRFSSLTVTEAFDTDGAPYITINDATAAAGEQNMLVKVSPETWPLALDVLGNAANIYSPSKVQIVTELSATAGQTLLSGANILALLGECLSRGAKVEWYMSTNGAAPGLADITASKLKGTFYPDLYNPLTSQQ